MAYIHRGRSPVALSRDPIDGDSTDWVYFIYDQWLTSNESITAHSELIVGGTIETGSTYVGPITLAGKEYQTVYAVRFKPASTACQVEITHRVSTTKVGAVDLGRTNIDHTVLIDVVSL